MAIQNPRTKVQKLFLADVEAARTAGVDIGNTSRDVYHAILSGLSYCNFPGWGAAPLTDEYLSHLNDILRDRAYEQRKYDSVKWTTWD
jgi:hypothetical protein